MIKTIGLAFLTCAAIGSGANAQQLSGARTAFRHDIAPAETTALQSVRVSTRDSSPSDEKMLAVGALYGAIGIFAGGGTGYMLETCAPDEWFCGLAGAVIGGTIGSTIMIPAGVHRAAGHASYGSKLGMSLLVTAGSLLAAPVTSGVSVLLMPVGQLVTSMSMEHRAAVRGRRAQR